MNTGIIYLDSAASSLTPEPVLDKMLEYYHQYRSNVERGVHQLSQRASEEYEKARIKVSGFINTKSSNDIIVTKNTTESINILANGLKWSKGDRIVTTSIEHHSNFIVWLRVKERYNIDLKIVKCNLDGTFDLEEFEKVIDDRTKLVTVTHASNVMGSITPVDEITKIAHKHGALTLLDSAQSVPQIKVDVRKIDCDFLAFSGHKMCGPTGVGILYAREELQDEIEPLIIGGGTIKDVGLDYYTLVKGAKKFEAGTPPIAEVIGLGAAIDYLQNIGIDSIREHDVKIMERMYNEMVKIPKITVYGPKPKLRVGLISFNIEGLSPHDVALALDATANIMIRSGAICTLPLMKGLIHQPSGIARASTYIYNTNEEIDRFIGVVSQLASSAT
ncbi:cysteine desulfurase [Candidatus Bathyarchaeota archaeon]|nr:cysteine desulfurase [Candidatus Bathyarchaeota archaeon]